MNVVLLGYPGSGKGTQAAVLSKRLGLPHLSTGDIFREEISRSTSLGKEVSGYISAGRLVPDQLVLEIVKKRLDKETGGVLLDGFPRTVEQAQGLDDYFSSKSRRVDAVVFLDIGESVVVSRLGSRRHCSGCGRIYNIVSSPPQKENACDVCGGSLSVREDDREEVVKKRIMVYKDLTEPLLAYYRGNGVFYAVKGEDGADAITERIMELLKGASTKN